MNTSSTDSVEQKLRSDLSQNPKLRKSFKLLKSHAASVANFTLQWQDLEDHFLSIDSSIQSLLLSLPDISKNTHRQHHNHHHLPEITDVKSLVLYLCEHSKELEKIRDHVCNTLRGFTDDDLGGAIVKAIGELFYPENGDVGFEARVVRMSCVLVLEEFAKLGVEVKEEAREEAREVAAGWKGRLQSSLEVYGYLRFLVGFGLVGEFGGEEVLRMFERVMQKKEAPELFQALGFAVKAPDFIQNLITQEKQPEAIKFIYAFELVDKFPPVPLLKAHLQYARNVGNMNCKKGKNSVQAQEAINTEIGALKAVVRCIETYKLGSQYPPENIRSRIKQLKRQRKERKATATAPGPKAQQQQRSGNKRTAHHPKAQQNQLSGNKRRRSAAPEPTAPTAYVSAASPIHSIQPSHHPAGLFARQSAQHLTSPAETAALNAPLGAASTIHSMHPSHHQPASLFTDQGAQHFNPSPFSRHYGLAGSPSVTPLVRSSARPYSLVDSTPVTQHMSLIAETYGSAVSAFDIRRMSSTAGSYGLPASSLDTQHMSSTGGSYGLASSVLDAQHMNSTAGSYGLVGSATVNARISSSAGQYGMSTGAYRSTAQLGLAGTPTTMGIAPSGSPDRYAPNYHWDPPRTPGYDRPVSYSSGYGVPLQRPPSIYYL